MRTTHETSDKQAIEQGNNLRGDQKETCLMSGPKNVQLALLDKVIGLRDGSGCTSYLDHILKSLF